ncbi:TPA: hypothetical protein ACMUZ3_000810 [Clostridioides difficile]|nr:hypothetical protein [Clostridioides difficile]MDC9276475.1 hypothetical protein [Clostridioides difficile]MDE3704141.1 hypothetical protein [Clostridioides difficile]MDI6392017.1 hypothetical protein [Clostridioides difficile]MDL0213499.1 hypothetical protein [Clostridioides difficile]MDL0266242.1 hypothetical protein [Clostridioides difficile]
MSNIGTKLTRSELIELSADALRCVYHRKTSLNNRSNPMDKGKPK